MVEQVDWLLFKLLVLGGLSDNYGNIWKRVEKQICVVECTLPKLHNYINDDEAFSVSIYGTCFQSITQYTFEFHYIRFKLFVCYHSFSLFN